MAFQSVPNTVEIRIIQTLGAQPIMTTFHADRGVLYSQAEIDTLAAQIDITTAPQFQALWTVHHQYVRTDVIGLHAINDITATANSNAGPGVVNERPLPNQVCFVLSKRTGLTGRSARGRTFWPGIPPSAMEQTLGADQFVKVVNANAYRGVVDGVRSFINGLGIWTAVIVSRYSGGSKRAAGVTFPWTTTTYTDRTPDTLRKRLS
jgi:hypothetical protein